jgi:hypothetical protein
MKKEFYRYFNILILGEKAQRNVYDYTVEYDGPGKNFTFRLTDCIKKYSIAAGPQARDRAPS